MTCQKQHDDRCTVQKVFYYQNRFITLRPATSAARSNSSVKLHLGREPVHDVGREERRAEHCSTPRPPPPPHRQGSAENMTSSDGLEDNYVITMQNNAAAGEDAAAAGFWARIFASSTILTKITTKLQDNRMSESDPELANTITVLNTKNQNSSLILKKILNIIFVTIGVVLLLSVVVVIIYTSIGKPGAHSTTFFGYQIETSAESPDQQTERAVEYTTSIEGIPIRVASTTLHPYLNVKHAHHNFDEYEAHQLLWDNLFIIKQSLKEINSEESTTSSSMLKTSTSSHYTGATNAPNRQDNDFETKTLLNGGKQPVIEKNEYYKEDQYFERHEVKSDTGSGKSNRHFDLGVQLTSSTETIKHHDRTHIESIFQPIDIYYEYEQYQDDTYLRQ